MPPKKSVTGPRGPEAPSVTGPRGPQGPPTSRQKYDAATSNALATAMRRPYVSSPMSTISAASLAAGKLFVVPLKPRVRPAQTGKAMSAPSSPKQQGRSGQRSQ